MSSNLAGILTETAERHGDRPALKLDDAVVTYAQLDEGSARLAGPVSYTHLTLPTTPYV